MTFDETCEYLGLGKTKLRELFKTCDWSLKIGAKWYAHRKRLDQWLLEQTLQK